MTLWSKHICLDQSVLLITEHFVCDAALSDKELWCSLLTVCFFLLQCTHFNVKECLTLLIHLLSWCYIRNVTMPARTQGLMRSCVRDINWTLALELESVSLHASLLLSCSNHISSTPRIYLAWFDYSVFLFARSGLPFMWLSVTK